MHLGGQEALIIILIILLLFGAKKLPELGRSLGQGMKEFRKSSKGILEDEEETPAKPSQGEDASPED